MHILGFDLLWAAKCAYPPRHMVAENFHDYYQIVFIHSGEGEVDFSDFSYDAQANQVYIFKPNVKHRLKASRTKYFNTIELKFYCNNIESNSFIMQLPSHIDNVDMQIRNIFMSIEEELRKKERYIEELIKTLLAQALYHLARNLYREDEKCLLGKNTSYTYGNKSSLNPLNDVIKYIHENYEQEITLEDLAGIVHLSPIYFCSVFRDTFGTSPMQYLQDIRLENAKQLLSNSNDSITNIAERVGFQSIHYFSRLFKAHEGVTPSYFRHINQGFICKDFHGGMTKF